MSKPKNVNSVAQKELDKAEKQFEAFEDNVKQMTMDRMNMAPIKEEEPQTKMSQKDIEKSKEIYLKPERVIGCKDKFNEDYRKQYEHDKQYVQFIAENKEIIGETIDIWTRPYGGVPAEYWRVPANKPVWGPRYLAEQIASRRYHRLVMQENITGGNGMTQFYGSMAVDSTIQRLDARPVSTKKTFAMSGGNF